MHILSLKIKLDVVQDSSDMTWNDICHNMWHNIWDNMLCDIWHSIWHAIYYYGKLDVVSYRAVIWYAMTCNMIYGMTYYMWQYMQWHGIWHNIA